MSTITANDAVIWSFQGAVVPGAAHVWATLGPSEAVFKSCLTTRGEFGLSALGVHYPEGELIALRHRLLCPPLRWTSYFTMPRDLNISEWFKPGGPSVIMARGGRCLTKREFLHQFIQRVLQGEGGKALHFFDAFEETVINYEPVQGLTINPNDPMIRNFYNPWRRSLVIGGLIGFGIGLIRAVFVEETNDERIGTILSSTLSGLIGSVLFTLVRSRNLSHGRQQLTPIAISLVASLLIEFGIKEKIPTNRA